jgi:acyl-CoA thioesterase FadM
MQTYSTQRTVRKEHLDEGEHANWLQQLAIAQDVQYEFRKKLGFELDFLKNEHKMFFVMGKLKDVSWRRQLRLGDVIDIEMTVWVASRSSLEYKCVYRIDGQIATEMHWVMPLISMERNKPVGIPEWIKEIVGPAPSKE